MPACAGVFARQAIDAAKPVWVVTKGSSGTRVDRDRRLVDALRRGEPTAVEHLVATYGDRANRLATRITGSEQDAEEIVQDVFWKVVRKIEGFRGDAAFGSWFYRIVANAAYQKLRSHRRSDISLDDLLPGFDETDGHGDTVADRSAAVADPSLHAELRMTLRSAIDALPVAYRTVFLLHVEGLSNGEIAEALEMSVSNVKVRVHRARLLLQKRLASYGPSKSTANAHISRSAESSRAPDCPTAAESPLVGIAAPASRREKCAGIV